MTDSSRPSSAPLLASTLGHTPGRAGRRPTDIPRFIRISRSIGRTLTKIGLNRERRLLLWAAAIGMTLAVVALAFILPIKWAERAAISWLHDHPGRAALAIAIVPVLGALACGVIQLAFPVKIRAHGVSSVLYAIHRRRSQLPATLALRTWFGATAIIATGGSAGPEGPIVTIGATLGSIISRFLRVDPRTATTMLGCGAAAGLAAVFNAPITGIFFVLEVLLRDFAAQRRVDLASPVVVCDQHRSARAHGLRGSQARPRASARRPDPGRVSTNRQPTICDGVR